MRREIRLDELSKQLRDVQRRVQGIRSAFSADVNFREFADIEISVAESLAYVKDDLENEINRPQRSEGLVQPVYKKCDICGERHGPHGGVCD